MDEMDELVISFNQILSDIFTTRTNASLQQLEQETGEQFLINLICPICKNFMEQAVYLDCSHRFCRECIQRSKKFHGILRCAICKIQSQVEYTDNLIGQINNFFNISLNQKDQIEQENLVEQYKKQNQNQIQQVKIFQTNSTTIQRSTDTSQSIVKCANKSDSQFNFAKSIKIQNIKQQQQLIPSKTFNSNKSQQQIEKIVERNAELYVLHFRKSTNITNFIFKMIESRVLCPIQSRGIDLKTHLSHKLGFKKPEYIEYLMVKSSNIMIEDDKTLFQVIKQNKTFNSKNNYQYEEKDIIQIVYNIKSDIIIDIAQQEIKKQERIIQ